MRHVQQCNERLTSTTGPALPANSAYNSWHNVRSAETEQPIPLRQETAKQWQDKAATITRLASNLAHRGEMEEAKEMQSQARDVIIEVKRRREEAKRLGVTANSGGNTQVCPPER